MSWETTKNEIMEKMKNIQAALKSSLDSSSKYKLSSSKMKRRSKRYETSSESEDETPQIRKKTKFNKKFNSDVSSSDGLSDSSDEEEFLSKIPAKSPRKYDDKYDSPHRSPFCKRNGLPNKKKFEFEHKGANIAKHKTKYYNASSSDDDSSGSAQEIYKKYSNMYSKSKIASKVSAKDLEISSDTYSDSSDSFDPKLTKKQQLLGKNKLEAEKKKYIDDSSDSSDEDYHKIVATLKKNRTAGSKNFAVSTSSSDDDVVVPEPKKATKSKKVDSFGSSDDYKPLSPCLASKKIIARLRKSAVSDSEDSDTDSVDTPKTDKNEFVQKYLKQISDSSSDDDIPAPITKKNIETKKKPASAKREKSSMISNGSPLREIESFEKNISPIAYKSPAKESKLAPMNKIPFDISKDDSSDIQEVPSKPIPKKITQKSSNLSFSTDNQPKSIPKPAVSSKAAKQIPKNESKELSDKNAMSDLMKAIDIDSIHDSPKDKKRRSSKYSSSPSSPIPDSDPSDFDDDNSKASDPKPKPKVTAKVNKLFKIPHDIDEEEASGEDNIDEQENKPVPEHDSLFDSDNSDEDLQIPQPRTKEWDDWLKKQVESIDDSDTEESEPEKGN